MTKKMEVKQNEGDKGTPESVETAERRPNCGIIRPIAPTEGYSNNHWSDVGEILAESIKSAGFEPRLVSEADSVAVIHGTIVQNIFEDSIIVCDVSSRNPNVMFELGMRLAFDKPVVIIKDDATNYAFDTGVIEHIPYPKSLHYHDIGIFKEKLRNKILNTIERAKDPNFSPFLKHFRNVSITPQKLQNEDIPLAEYVVDKLDALEAKINRITQQTSSPYSMTIPKRRRVIRISAPTTQLTQAAKLASAFDPTSSVSRTEGDIIVNTTLTSEEASKLARALSYLEEGIPVEMLLDTARTDTPGNSAISSRNNPYAFANETHPIPE